jgi:acylphosphatase
MSQWQMIEELKAGHVEAVIAAMEENENQYEAWCEEQANTLEAMEVARELCSTPEQLEAVPW